jgi:outer membrane protein assembly factor BamB
MKKSRILLALISLIITASLLSGCTGAGTATTTSWPGLTLDPEAGVGYVAHGSHVYAINLLNGSQIWRFPNEPVRNSTFDAPPAITGKGEIVFGGYDKKLYLVRADNGSQIWVNEDATNRYYARPLTIEQTIYAPNTDNHLYTIEDGLLKWDFESADALWASPVTDGNVIYQASMDHTISALDPLTGDVIWQSEELGGSITSAPVLDTNGRLYAGTLGNRIVALDSKNGEIIWQKEVAGWISSSPLLHEGVLYFGDLEGYFYAMDAENGQEKWTPIQPDTTATREISSTPGVIEDTIYFTNEGGYLYAIDSSNGATQWSKQFDFGKLYAPVQVLDDTIYLTPLGTGPIVVALDANGNQRWEFKPGK